MGTDLEPLEPLARAPLSAADLRRALVGTGDLWTGVRVVAETGSTNSDVAAAARAGAAEGLVVVAEYQHAGRGRAGRSWSAPPGAGLAVSVLLHPGAVPEARWGWLPLLVGVALGEAVTGTAALAADLKWPNDLLLRERKCAGILSEVVGRSVVVGVGVNVTQRADELPPPGPGALPATSLALAGAGATDRAALLCALLQAVERWYGRWRAAGGDAEACGLRAAYLRRCGTIGRPVRVLLPDGTGLTGDADTVDSGGGLVVRTAAGTRTLAAGDVTHLRQVGGPAGPSGGCGYGVGALR